MPHLTSELFSPSLYQPNTHIFPAIPHDTCLTESRLKKSLPLLPPPPKNKLRANSHCSNVKGTARHMLLNDLFQHEGSKGVKRRKRALLRVKGYSPLHQDLTRLNFTQCQGFMYCFALWQRAGEELVKMGEWLMFHLHYKTELHWKWVGWCSQHHHAPSQLHCCQLHTPILRTTQQQQSAFKKNGIFRSENLSLWVDTSYSVLDLFNSTQAKLSKSCVQSGLLEIYFLH